MLTEIGPLLADDPGDLPVPSGMLLEISAARLPRGAVLRATLTGSGGTVEAVLLRGHAEKLSAVLERWLWDTMPSRGGH